MHRRRHGDLREPCGHELEQGHLGGGVLHGDPVGAQVVVGDRTLDGGGRVGELCHVEVVEEDLLGKGERPAEALTADGQTFLEGGVDAVDELDRGGGFDGHENAPCFGEECG